MVTVNGVGKKWRKRKGEGKMEGRSEEEVKELEGEEKI